MQPRATRTVSAPAPEVRLPRSLPPVRTDALSRDALSTYFENTWELYEVLFSSIDDDASLYAQPDPLRHPLVFYLGHTAAFYVNKLVLSGLLPESRRICPELELLFEQGVDPGRAEDLGAVSWPAVAEVREFRGRVLDLVREVIATCDLSGPVDATHPLWAVLMGLEHDRIHFETSSVLLRQCPEHAVTRPAGWSYAPIDAPVPEDSWVTVPGGRVTLGKPAGFPTFGWDNEYGRLDVDVPAFEAARHLVTNAAFLEFLLDGGYEQRALWSDAGWAWRAEHDVRHPRFWIPRAGQMRYRAMFDVLDLPLAWPAEVTCHEAEAFCAWVGDGARLPTEAEFHAMAATAAPVEPDLPWSRDHNLALRHGSPSPVGAMPTRSRVGLTDLWGNVWQWLADDFRGLPGFETHPYYRDFSEPYMDAEHATLLGGSWASSGTSASRFYRLWFRRFFHQHAGFRVVRDL